MHLSVPERGPRDLTGFAAWIRVSSVRFASDFMGRSLALVHLRSLSRSQACLGATSSIDFCSYKHARGHNPHFESSGLAPIVSLIECEPEPTFVKTTHATLSRSAPSRSRMTGPACDATR
jgi:hypothetical protein